MTSSLAMMFKPAPGSWNCDTCLVPNKQEAAQCVACSFPNPNASTPVKAEVDNAASSPFASFKFSPSSIPAEGTAATASPAPSFGFKFTGIPSTAATTTVAALPKTAASTVAAATPPTTSTPCMYCLGCS
ncbi:Nuclear pore complex protein Nup153 [Portunus trituberculatus]|uniref:Nuclear pore complex protein Nup153 n=1 Tax=Portunus trituberculatus TaxID=210409 RepID=A0A5B7JQ38_PORTR|nr:Nuclear pore complex protein Nup153 [Portunus trituberculatus]